MKENMADTTLKQGAEEEVQNGNPKGAPTRIRSVVNRESNKESARAHRPRAPGPRARGRKQQATSHEPQAASQLLRPPQPSRRATSKKDPKRNQKKEPNMEDQGRHDVQEGIREEIQNGTPNGDPPKSESEKGAQNYTLLAPGRCLLLPLLLPLR